MTFNEAKRALIIHFSPEERSIPDTVDYPGRNESVERAINAALQELNSLNAPWQRRTEYGFIAQAPASVTVTVTEGSRLIDFGPDWQDWFEGCTLRVSNAEWENRIRGKNVEGQCLLVSPHDGATSTVSATVFCDSITLDDEIQEVMTPVFIKGQLRMHPVSSVSNLAHSIERFEDYGMEDSVHVAPNPPTIEETSSCPRRYAIDPGLVDQFGKDRRRLRFYPAADKKYLIEARVRLSMPVYKGVDDTDIDLPIPNDYCESILLPIAEFHLIRSPFFRDRESVPGIQAGYQAAKEAMNNLKPQRGSGKRLSSTM